MLEYQQDNVLAMILFIINFVLHNDKPILYNNLDGNAIDMVPFSK